MSEKHTSIPHRFKVTMDQTRRIPRDEGDTHWSPRNQSIGVDSHMVLTGSVHPVEYSHQAAHAEVIEYLAPLLALGWRIKAMELTR